MGPILTDCGFDSFQLLKPCRSRELRVPAMTFVIWRDRVHVLSRAGISPTKTVSTAAVPSGRCFPRSMTGRRNPGGVFMPGGRETTLNPLGAEKT